MDERKNVITIKGNPLTLLGPELQQGREAPDCELVDNNLSTVNLSSYRGKVCIISSVPSLDTSVCSTMTRRFNEEAGRLGEDVVVLTVSMDLPFAQKRWCGSEGIQNVITLSDHREAAFGKNYGVLIKELRLLARTVFVVDKQGIIRYIERVKEQTDEPAYEAAINAAKELL